MEPKEQLMHFRAGKAYGRWATCGNKIKHKTEDEARSLISEQDAATVEAYPCFYCKDWHIGRVLREEERTKFSKRTFSLPRPHSFKRWFNDRFWNEPLMAAVHGEKSGGRGPFFYELCGHAWCPRMARYDHRCGRHQDDP